MQSLTPFSKTANGVAERFAFVDLLRGLAILGVITVHVSYSWYVGIPKVWRTFGDLGRYGVDLFFIVSAFTLFRSCRDLTVWKFILRRWLRLAPIYYLGILIYAVKPWLSGEIPAPKLTDILANLAFVNAWWPGHCNNIVPGGWSISTEVMFYLLLPLIVRWVHSWRRALVAFFVLLVVNWTLWNSAVRWGSGAQVSLLNESPIWHLPTFMLGIVLYFVRPLVNRKLGWPLIVAGASAFVAICRDWVWFHNWRPTAAGIPLFMMALGMSVLVSEFNLRPVRWLRWLGTVSYSTYLLHFWAIDTVAAIVVGVMFPAEAMHMMAVTFPLALILSVALAALSRRFIEEPAQRLANRLSPHSNSKSSLPTGQNQLARNF